MMRVEPIQAVMDAGSSKIRVTVANRDRAGNMEIIGCGVSTEVPTKSGQITDLQATAQAMRDAIDEAERESGLQIQNIDASLGGQCISGINTDAATEVLTRHIPKAAILNLVCEAKSQVESENYELIHALVQQFIVDEHSGIDYPLGMTAEHLEARLHIIRAQKNIKNNLKNAIEATGVGINSFIFSGLASAYAATTAAQRDLGVCVLDIGAGTTDYIVFKGDRPRFSGAINLGGDDVSSDIANVLATPRSIAEELKCLQGAMLPALYASHHIEVPSLGFRDSRKVEAQHLCEIITSRYEDIFECVQRDLQRSGVRSMNNMSLVLTGGGANIHGIAQYLNHLYGLQISIATPQWVKGMPDNLQNNNSMMVSLGMLNLLYEPIADYAWVKPSKRGIIGHIKHFFRRS